MNDVSVYCCVIKSALLTGSRMQSRLTTVKLSHQRTSLLPLEVLATAISLILSFSDSCFVIIHLTWNIPIAACFFMCCYVADDICSIALLICSFIVLMPLLLMMMEEKNSFKIFSALCHLTHLMSYDISMCLGSEDLIYYGMQVSFQDVVILLILLA